MNERIEELKSYTKVLCGLDTYEFKDYHIFYNEEIGYTFNSEWLLESTPVEEDSSNPEGTASVEIRFHTRELVNIVFVGGKSFATDGILPNNDKDMLLDWIEEKTNMMYGKQFQLTSESELEQHYRASIDNIPVAPSGDIHVKFNKNGQLISFLITGVFPTEDEVNWEPYSLTPAETDPLLPTLCHQLNVPIEKTMSWEPYYVIDDVFISNDGKQITNAKSVNQHKVYYEKNALLKWTGKPQGTIHKKKIDMSVSFTVEDAMKDETNFNKIPLTDTEQQNYINEATRAMQIEYPEDSGLWAITALYKEHNHVFAELHLYAEQSAVPKRIRILMNEKFETVNIIDNNFLIQLLDTFKEAPKAELSKDKALEQLTKHIHIVPAYVYNREINLYELQGEVKCELAIHAITGELVKTSTILD